jgi:hypothetical protein
MLSAMGKGRFLNQKLGKRMSRKFDLLKSQLAGQHPGHPAKSDEVRLPKKGASREGRPRS